VEEEALGGDIAIVDSGGERVVDDDDGDDDDDDDEEEGEEEAVMEEEEEVEGGGEVGGEEEEVGCCSLHVEKAYSEHIHESIVSTSATLNSKRTPPILTSDSTDPEPSTLAKETMAARLTTREDGRPLSVMKPHNCVDTTPT